MRLLVVQCGPRIAGRGPAARLRGQGGGVPRGLGRLVAFGDVQALTPASRGSVTSIGRQVAPAAAILPAAASVGRHFGWRIIWRCDR